MTNINGSTHIYGVIGCPIEHTSSPFIHNTVCDEINKNFAYTAFKVEPENLETAVKGAYALGIKGLNVTVPHKKAIMPFLCNIDKTAEAVGAVNTVKYTDKGYEGYNTDMIGVYYALKENGTDVKDKNVLILGAGGAANACTAMAAAYGAKKIHIANRTVANAEKLCNHISKYYQCEYCVSSLEDIKNINDCQIVINSTTMGFKGQEELTPINDENFFKNSPVETVLDAIYSPWETKLLRQAKQVGIKNVINGFPMLIFQALAAEEIWFGKEFTPEFRKYLYNVILKKYNSQNNQQ